MFWSCHRQALASQRLLRRRIAPGDAPEGDAFREIAAALIADLEYGAVLADRLEPRYRPVSPVERATLRIRAQAALRVRPARVERDSVEGWLRDRPHRAGLALEVGIAPGGPMAVPRLHRPGKQS